MTMKRRILRRLAFPWLLLCALAAPTLTNAQYFNYYYDADVLAGFRKTGAYQGNYELVVNLGDISGFLSAAPGTSFPITAYSPQQLSDSFPDGFNDLQWSVFCAAGTGQSYTNAIGIFPEATLWYTKASPGLNTQSQPPRRLLFGFNAGCRQAIFGVGGGAVTISASLPLGADNTTNLVREPISFTAADLTAFIGDRADPTIGDFDDTVPSPVENTTPDNFTNTVRSDFYQAVALDYVDPITGQTNGNAYFAGYFLLEPDGTMTFTRSSTTTTNSPPPPPPAPRLALARSGGVNTISFPSTNGATYTLLFTNSAGLSAPASTWPSLPAQLTGNGASMSFEDSATDPNRYYRVKAQ
jgi:hypothetical protein